jgi:hypothetical protein
MYVWTGRNFHLERPLQALSILATVWYSATHFGGDGAVVKHNQIT